MERVTTKSVLVDIAKIAVKCGFLDPKILEDSSISTDLNEYKYAAKKKQFQNLKKIIKEKYGYILYLEHNTGEYPNEVSLYLTVYH